MDRAHDKTDREIASVEKRINKVYAALDKDLVKMSEKYFSQFEDADSKKLKELEDGTITETEYKNWRIATMMSGRKWSDFQKAMAKRIYEANREAVAISNSAMTDVFIENYNHVGKDIERQVREIR